MKKLRRISGMPKKLWHTVFSAAKTSPAALVRKQNQLFGCCKADGCKDRTRTCDLKGMNLASCRCSTLPNATSCATLPHEILRWGRTCEPYAIIISLFFLKFNEFYCIIFKKFNSFVVQTVNPPHRIIHRVGNALPYQLSRPPVILALKFLV